MMTKLDSTCPCPPTASLKDTPSITEQNKAFLETCKGPSGVFSGRIRDVKEYYFSDIAFVLCIMAMFQSWNPSRKRYDW